MVSASWVTASASSVVTLGSAATVVAGPATALASSAVALGCTAAVPASSAMALASSAVALGSAAAMSAFSAVACRYCLIMSSIRWLAGLNSSGRVVGGSVGHKPFFARW
eukprot:6214480-Pleurochrysis_carterae.AAC.1